MASLANDSIQLKILQSFKKTSALVKCSCALMFLSLFAHEAASELTDIVLQKPDTAKTITAKRMHDQHRFALLQSNDGFILTSACHMAVT